jgi:hypothetical protein
MLDRKALSMLNSAMRDTNRQRAAGLLFAISTLILGCSPGYKKYQNISGLPHSIVKVQGGSIDGEAGLFQTQFWNRWSTITPNGIYSAPVANNDLIKIGDFTSNPGNIQGTGGWAIKFTNPDGNGGEKPAALSLCSDQNCSMSLKSGDPVYLSLRSGMVVTSYLLGEDLSLHDPSCAQSGSTACDYIVHMTISATNAVVDKTTSQTYTCGADRKCWVSVGQ